MHTQDRSLLGARICTSAAGARGWLFIIVACADLFTFLIDEYFDFRILYFLLILLEIIFFKEYEMKHDAFVKKIEEKERKRLEQITGFFKFIQFHVKIMASCIIILMFSEKAKASSSVFLKGIIDSSKNFFGYQLFPFYYFVYFYYYLQYFCYLKNKDI